MGIQDVKFEQMNNNLNNSIKLELYFNQNSNSKKKAKD